MTPCEEILRTLVSGDPWTAQQRAHQEGCPGCQQASGLVGELSAGRKAAFSHHPPGAEQLRRRSLRRTAGRAVMLGSALLLLVLLFRGGKQAGPDVDVLATLEDTQQVLDLPENVEIPPGTELLQLWEAEATETDPFLDEWSL